MVYKFFDKRSSGGCVDTSLGSKSATEPNYQLRNELHKQIIRKFMKRKLYSSFRDNIWGVDLADIQSLSKYSKGIKYLLCAIDLFSKYAWIVPWKDKREVRIVNAFQKIISKGRRPNKTWVDQGGEFYNNLFKSFLKIKIIDMYSTYNEEKSVVADRFVRTLKNKIFKHLKPVSKNVYSDILHDIFVVSKITNTVPWTYTISDLNGEPIARSFYEKELQKN